MEPRKDEKETKEDAKAPRVFPFKFELSKPLHTHKGDVTFLELRELTADDLINTKTAPIVVTYATRGIGEKAERETRIEEHYDRMSTLAAKMTGVDVILLGAMPAKDFRRLCNVIGEIWKEAEGE